MVKISMDCFVKKFQPDKYALWKSGKDIAPHPEDDQSRLYPGQAKKREEAAVEAAKEATEALEKEEAEEKEREKLIA